MNFVSSIAAWGHNGGMRPGDSPVIGGAWRRTIAVLLTLWAALTLIGILASAAPAATNIGPSTAKPVKIGVPFTGAWAGTKFVSGRGYTHWWRLPEVMRPGDEMQLAVDNRSGTSIEICLLPPVDDFGANTAFAECESSYRGSEVYAGIQDRRVFPYGGAAGQPFLVVQFDSNEGFSSTYTLTLERIVSVVNIGMVVPRRLPSSFALTANLTYGDNTPAGDGIPAVLQWRFLPTSKDNPPPFADIATAHSTSGVATFTGTMPPEAQGGNVQLRACVAQPGGDSGRCGATAQATVAVSACSRALASRRANTRAVRKLKRKLRRARARGRVAPRMRLRMKAKRKQLAKAKRAVKVYC